MTTQLKSTDSNRLRATVALFLALVLALALAACGGRDDSDSTVPIDNPDLENPLNPENLDANKDGIIDADDDINGDGVVNQLDENLFLAANPDPNAWPANIPPDCSVVDCNSSNSVWDDNASVSLNKSPRSTYVMGIQRILYCLNAENSQNKTVDEYVDGVYGEQTYNDVRTYQSDEGLPVDGEVGPNTWFALRQDLDDLLIADFQNNLFGVNISSSRVGCNSVAQFAQLIAEPQSWQLLADPGGTTYIPFSANFFDLPLPLQDL